MRKSVVLTACILVIITIIATQQLLFADAPVHTAPPVADRALPITIGWVGDMVPSSDPSYNAHAFDAVDSILEVPDFMIGNLEGTFAKTDHTTKCARDSVHCYTFRGDAGFADTLKSAGFDMVSLVNNHSMDYGSSGLVDTEDALDRAGIPYISPTNPTISITVNGKHIGVLGVSSTPPANTISDYDFITTEVNTLKAHNDFVIVIMHAGAEGANRTTVTGTEEFQGSEDRGNVALLAHTAIDSGADLVLGSGPHVLRKIERYNHGVIAYSLGNFVGGSGRLDTSGILATSGIFAATLEQYRPTTYSFTSIKLTRGGFPFYDNVEEGKQLIDSL